MPLAAAAGPELRVHLLVKDLQRQFAAYLGTPTRARGYPPMEGEHSLIVEVAPALAIERVTDLALRAVPAVEPGILFVERQFGVLEVHGPDLADVQRAGEAILAGLHASAADQLRPRILFCDVIEDITDRQAVIINRNRGGSMIIPGGHAAGLRGHPGAVRQHRGERGRAHRARGDPGRRVHDRRGRPHLPERAHRRAPQGPGRDRHGPRRGRRQGP
jgi:hypothetical protein